MTEENHQESEPNQQSQSIWRRPLSRRFYYPAVFTLMVAVGVHSYVQGRSVSVSMIDHYNVQLSQVQERLNNLDYAVDERDALRKKYRDSQQKVRNLKIAFEVLGGKVHEVVDEAIDNQIVPLHRENRELKQSNIELMFENTWLTLKNIYLDLQNHYLRSNGQKEHDKI
ncbi:MAG: hypothetical protein QGH47_05715 [Candidatus Woesearchaeota archaeon]|jgi:hypothetical protein|nr:hypothetical protein [Candidatus Woesearchaeota archaeon]